MTEVT